MTHDHAQQAHDAPRPFVMYWPQSSTPQHERVAHAHLARRLAALLGYGYAGEQVYEQEEAERERNSPPANARWYVVPALTLDDALEVRAHGIQGEADLFGGFVPHPLLATKIITHDLVDADARAAAGWPQAFARRVAPAVLDGFSVFTREDAHRAGRILLQDGPVRLKPARARGGRGQTVVADVAALQLALDEMDDDELNCTGLVLEEDLRDLVTYSVGQLRLPDLPELENLPGRMASYWGTQRLTEDNNGALVYGGSDLEVAAGGFDALLERTLSAEAHRAVEHARRYDQAASECLEGFFASRRNYDIVIGRNARGRCKCGVLEQSWRIGGASGAEIAALEVLKQGGAKTVRASVVERYGDLQAPLPQGAQVLYQGDDAEVGPVTKYSWANPLHPSDKQ